MVTEENVEDAKNENNDKVKTTNKQQLLTSLLQLNGCKGCSGCTDDSSTLSLIQSNENLTDSDPLPVVNCIRIINIDENITIIGKQLNFNDESDDNNKDDDYFIPKTVNMSNINVSKSPINPISTISSQINKSHHNDDTSSSKNTILKPTLFAGVSTVNENSEKVLDKENDKEVKQQPTTENTFSFGSNKTNLFDNKNFVFNTGMLLHLKNILIK